jgi:hypothetical protein
MDPWPVGEYHSRQKEHLNASPKMDSENISVQLEFFIFHWLKILQNKDTRKYSKIYTKRIEIG